MIQNIEIKNFRSIVDANVSLGRVNLFIGPNGSGKSNLLEAIGILSAALGRSIEPDDLDRKGVRLSLPRMFKASFKNRNLPKTFQIKATARDTRYDLSVVAGDSSSSLKFRHEAIYDGDRKRVGRGPRGVRIHPKPSEKIGPLFHELEEKGFFEDTRGMFDVSRRMPGLFSENARSELDALGSYAIYTPQTSILRGVATDSRVVEPLGLTGGNLPNAIASLLTYIRKCNKKEQDRIERCLEMVWKMGWPEAFSVGKPQSDIVPSQVPTLPKVLYIKDEYMHTRRNWLSAFDASEGVLYVTFVAALLAHPEAPQMFSLDNVDGTLNPALVKYLVEEAANLVTERQGHQQIFMTSHNPTALDALDLFNEDHRVYAVYRDNDTGQTKFKRIKPPDGMTRAEFDELRGGRNTSAMWLEGMIPEALNEL